MKREPVAVYLGPIPSPEGFVASSEAFKDSYKDLREELRKNRDFQKVIELVSDPDQARLVIEVVDRGLVDTGMRTGNAVATGPTTAVGTSVPVRTKQLARLAVRGTTYAIDIDGAAGIRLRTYRSQAKNVLQQVIDWVEANRDKLRLQ
ncbi:MAG: hypothetical protein K2Y23_24460 [Cyanobacteria bacterium]|nr:hypothetical protein [Cyanobacteriota bacterium]